MIPKTIHYIWVGGKPFPKSAEKCLSSWQKFLPDYEIKLWNEENSPMNHPYVKAMYKRGKWAFAADYIRFWVLSREGGIYLDTDQEVFKSLDPLLDHDVFLGRSSDGFIACGIIGSVPNHPFIEAVLGKYDEYGESPELVTSPRVVTAVYESFPDKSDITIYEPKYFYPCNADEKCTKDKLGDAYASHHWAETWVSFRLLRKFLRRIGVLKFLKKFKS